MAPDDFIAKLKITGFCFFNKRNLCLPGSLPGIFIELLWFWYQNVPYWTQFGGVVWIRKISWGCLAGEPLKLRKWSKKVENHYFNNLKIVVCVGMFPKDFRKKQLDILNLKLPASEKFSLIFFCGTTSRG